MKIQCRASFAARTILAAFVAGAVAGAVMTMVLLDATTNQQTVDNAATAELSSSLPHQALLRLDGDASSVVPARPPDPSGTGRRVDR
jgi:hypothetical protein